MSVTTYTCKDLDGNDVVITYKTVLSAYDQEKIDEVYMSNMVYNPETQKAEINGQMGALPIKRQNAILENMIKSWTRPEGITADNIKKALSREAFSGLVVQLESVVSQGEVDEAKKKNSPES